MMRGNQLPALATVSTYLETPRVLSFPIFRRTAQSGYSSLSKKYRCRALAVSRAYSAILHPRIEAARLSRPLPFHPPFTPGRHVLALHVLPSKHGCNEGLRDLSIKVPLG